MRKMKFSRTRDNPAKFGLLCLQTWALRSLFESSSPISWELTSQTWVLSAQVSFLSAQVKVSVKLEPSSCLCASEVFRASLSQPWWDFLHFRQSQTLLPFPKPWPTMRFPFIFEFQNPFRPKLSYKYSIPLALHGHLTLPYTSIPALSHCYTLWFTFSNCYIHLFNTNRIVLRS